MLSILQILLAPGSKFIAVLRLLFRTVSPLLRYALAVSPPQQATHLALPHYSSVHYAPLQLDPPPGPTRTRYEPSYSARSLSIWTESRPEFRAAHSCFTLLLVLGTLVTVVSVFISLAGSCFSRSEWKESSATHVAEVYKSVTGQPYHVSSHWELVLHPSMPPVSLPCSSDVDLNLHPEFLFGRGECSNPSPPSQVNLSSLGTPLDVRGPPFMHLINQKTIDDYVKLLTDEGYTDFQYCILDIDDRNAPLTIVKWEFSARSADIDVFMDMTLRVMPLKDIPPTGTDLVLWDMGRGDFKAVEILELSISTRDHVEEVEEEDDSFTDGQYTRPSVNLFGTPRNVGAGSPAELDTDSDDSFDSERERRPSAFGFSGQGGGGGTFRAPSFTFDTDLSDPFDDSSAETSTDSERFEDSVGDTSADSDDVFASSSSRRGGFGSLFMDERPSNSGPFPLPSTPKSRLFRGT